MLGDFPRNAWHVRGFPCKDIFVGEEEVDERAFLFRGKHGANAHHLALEAARIYEDLLGALRWLERPYQPLGVGRFFSDLLPDGRELSKGDDCYGVIATLGLTLVGMLEGGADSDDSVGARHLQLEVGVVGDGHELHVAWLS